MKYIPSPLPRLLDREGNPRGSSTLLNQGLRNSFSERSQSSKAGTVSCIQVVHDNIAQFLSESSSTIQSDRLFNEWLRRFHDEYDDSWFVKNQKRLKLSFKPIWDQSLRSAVNQSREKLIPITAINIPCDGNSLMGIYEDGEVVHDLLGYTESPMECNLHLSRWVLR
jgi:hypothetical protein